MLRTFCTTGCCSSRAAAGFLMLLLLGACSRTPEAETAQESSAPAATPPVKRNYLISSDSVGNIRVGATSEALAQVLQGERLAKEEYEKEGQPYTAVVVFHEPRQEPSLILAMDCATNPCTVRNIAIHDSAYHTRTGLRLGSTLGQIRQHHKLLYSGWGEGGYVAVLEDMPLTFELQVQEQNGQRYNGLTLPDSARVSGLFMYRPYQASGEGAAVDK